MRGTSPGLPGLYAVPSFRINDRVRLKGSGSANGGEEDKPGLRSISSRNQLFAPLEGRIVQVTTPGASGKSATVRVRWSQGHEQDYSVNDVEPIRTPEPVEAVKNEAPAKNAKVCV